MSTLSSEIEQQAQDPKRMRVDGNEIEQQSLKDLIEADEYLCGQAANAKSTLPIRLAKLRPDGAL